MAEVKRIDFRIDLLKLLAGRVDLPEIALSQPRIALEVSRSGAVNWVFKEQVEARPLDLPAIGMLSIDGGTATYRDPVHNTDLALELKTLGGRGEYVDLRPGTHGERPLQGPAVDGQRSRRRAAEFARCAASLPDRGERDRGNNPFQHRRDVARSAALQRRATQLQDRRQRPGLALSDHRRSHAADTRLQVRRVPRPYGRRVGIPPLQRDPRAQRPGGGFFGRSRQAPAEAGRHPGVQGRGAEGSRRLHRRQTRRPAWPGAAHQGSCPPNRSAWTSSWRPMSM